MSNIYNFHIDFWLCLYYTLIRLNDFDFFIHDFENLFWKFNSDKKGLDSFQLPSPVSLATQPLLTTLCA